MGRLPVALALARDSANFKAGFDMAGTHAGPIASIDTWESPLMLVQGDDDRNVSIQQGVNLVETYVGGANFLLDRLQPRR